MKSRLIVSGAFRLHLLYCVLEDLFVTHISLDEMFEAGHHSLGLLVKLKHSQGHLNATGLIKESCTVK